MKQLSSKPVKDFSEIQFSREIYFSSWAWSFVRRVDLYLQWLHEYTSEEVKTEYNAFSECNFHSYQNKNWNFWIVHFIFGAWRNTKYLTEVFGTWF
jgi:hypothetical protein